MKYRDHRGSLSESLLTIQEFETTDELINHLNKDYAPFNKEVEEIKFEYVGLDDRIGWDTYNVSLRLKDEISFFIAGMSDGELRN